MADISLGGQYSPSTTPKTNVWLDMPGYSSLSLAVRASALAAGMSSPSSVLGRVTATRAEEPSLPAGWVRVEIPASAPTSSVTGPVFDGLLSAVGALVMVTLDQYGRVQSIGSALEVPEGAEAVAMGAAGEHLLEAREAVQAALEAVEGAKADLEENARLISENEAKAESATADAASAVEQARAAVAAGEAAQARADEVAGQAAEDRARLDEVAAEAARVSDAEARAQDAWNRAVKAGEDSAAALAAAPDLTGPWTRNWRGGAQFTVTDSQMSVTNSDTADSYANRFMTYTLREFPARSGRVYRYEAVVSATADSTVAMGMYYVLPDGKYVSSYWPDGNRKSVRAGADRVTLSQDFTPQFSDAKPRAQFASYVNAGGGTVTIHSARVVDITDAAEAMAAAQAAQDAASTATQAATRAQATADSRNQIVRSTATPSGRGSAPGDVWWRYGSSSLSGAIIGAWTWNGTQWQPSTIGSEIVASLTADKLRAAQGTIDTGFMNDLVSHRVFTDELYTSRLSVAGGNLFPDPHFDDTNGWPTNSWFRIINAENNSGIANKRYVRIDETSSQRGMYYRAGERGVVLEPGQSYHVKAKVFAGGTGAKSGMAVRIFFRGKNSAGSYQYPSVTLPVSVVNGWQTVEADFTYYPSIVTTADVGLYTGGVFVSGAYVCVADIQVTKKVGAVLIEDGAVTAEKITASRELSAKVGNFLEVKTDQLRAGSAAIASDLIAGTLRGKEIVGSTIRSGTSYSQRLESSTIVSPSIQAGTISAPTINGGNINGTHFTGGDLTFVNGNDTTLVDAQKLTYKSGSATVGDISWRSLVAPPWCNLAWKGPAGEPKAPGAEALLRADYSTTRQVGNGAYIKGQYVAFPVSGWYLVSVSTAWFYGTWKTWGDPYSVASGVWQEAGNGIDWYTAPAMTEYLVSGVSTHPSASGLMHLNAGAGITLGWWWGGPGTSWNPNAPRNNWLQARLIQAD